jgi:formylglycine-generating enzyme required for sulfatase activity
MTYAGNMSQEGVCEFSFSDSVASRVGYYVANWNEEFGPVDGSCAIERRCGPGPVGRHQPNAFGLYDILGNVEEVVLDTFNPRTSVGGADVVGVYGVSSNIRGGSYVSPYIYLRAGWRGGGVRDDAPAFYVGVRLVRTVIQ